MIYVLYGPDTYSRGKELADIKKSLGDADMLSLNTSVLDGNTVTINDIRDNFCTAPFLNPFRLTIVEGFMGRFEPESKRKQGKSNVTRKSSNLCDLKALAECLKQLPSTAVLIFIEDMITKANAVFKVIAPLAETRSFALLRESGLFAWINNRVKAEGGEISSGAIRILIDLVGSDLWTLHNELNKLLSYCSGRTINEKDVREITSYSRDINIFNVVDCIIEKRLGQAQLLVKRMVKEGASPLYIINMIQRQLRLIVQAKYLQKGVDKSESLAKLGLNSEFALNKTIKQARIYSIQQLQALYEKLLELDVSIKTGKYAGDIEADLIIFELCREQ